MESSEGFSRSGGRPQVTLDIEAGVLRQLKRLQERERKSMGQLVSELLTGALAAASTEVAPEPAPWTTAHLGEPLVDLDGGDNLWTAVGP